MMLWNGNNCDANDDTDSDRSDEDVLMIERNQLKLTMVCRHEHSADSDKRGHRLELLARGLDLALKALFKIRRRVVPTNAERRS